MLYTQEFISALTAAFLVSTVAFIGLLYMLLPKKWVAKAIPLAIALAIGILLGNAFFHLIPEAALELREPRQLFMWVSGGFLLFLTIEIITHSIQKHKLPKQERIRSIGILNLVGDGIHNFLDGIIIASSFLISPELGTATTMAILMHEIPQEFSDSGTLIYSGYKPARVVKLNFMVALTSILGVVFVFLLSETVSMNPVYLLAITAGGFIYMAAGNLLPAIVREGKNSNKLHAKHLGIATLGLLMIFWMSSSGHDHKHHQHGNSSKARSMGAKYFQLQVFPDTE